MTLFKFTAIRSLGVISGFCVALLAPSMASAVIIDSFANAVSVARTKTETPGTDSTTQLNLSGVVNTGDRTTSATLTTFGAGPGTSAATVTIGGGFLVYNEDSGITGGFELSYEDFGLLDLSPNGTVFQVPIVFNDGGGTFTLSLSDGVTTETEDHVVADGVLGAVNILTNAANFGAVINLAAITKIVFTFVGADAATDLTLGDPGLQITSVPEPSSLALVFTGLGFAGVYFRRRRKSLTA